MTDARFRDWFKDERRDDHALDFEDCCGTPLGEHVVGCVYGLGPVPRRALALEGDRVDSEQDSIGMFDRPWLAGSADATAGGRELPLEGPDWDQTSGGRRLP